MAAMRSIIIDPSQPPEALVADTCSTLEGAPMQMREVHEGLLIADTTAEIDDNVLMGTRLLSRAVTEIYDGKLRPFGINAIHFALLDAIGRTEPTTRAALAKIEHLDKSTLTRNLKSIVFEGWVHEVREGANGRTRPMVLTKSGKQFMLDARPAWLAARNEVKALLGQ